MSTRHKVVKKLLAGFRMRVALVAIPVVLLLLVASAGTATAEDNDNFDDLWESSIGQYEKLFPIPEMLYISLLMVLSVGVYMKSNSLGVVTAFLVLGGVLVVGAVGDLGKLVFGFAMIISIAFLVYMVYRRR